MPPIIPTHVLVVGSEWCAKRYAQVADKTLVFTILNNRTVYCFWGNDRDEF